MEMREHKKETKCGFGGVSMYDQQGIEKKLADMARKGWLIEEIDVYKRQVQEPAQNREQAHRKDTSHALTQGLKQGPEKTED